jgi:hypothetical protein
MYVDIPEPKEEKTKPIAEVRAKSSPVIDEIVPILPRVRRFVERLIGE